MAHSILDRGIAMKDDEVLDFLTPKAYNQNDLKRFGREQDGGYVIPVEYCKRCKTLMSFGVGDDISFERDFIKENPNVDVELYDGTVDALPENIVCNFHRQNCEFGKTNPFDGVQPPVFCKMDIEGEEYNLPKLSTDLLSGVECIVMEVHFLDGNKEKAESLFSYLSDCGMSVIHLHGNNNSSYQFSFGVKMPQTLELTMIKKSIAEKSDASFPIKGLDFPCNPFREDLSVFG